MNERLRQVFHEHRWSPAHWINLADDLHEAARSVWERWKEQGALSPGTAGPINFGLGSIALMLAGMALEDLIKASFAAQELEIPTKGHNLRRLANKAAISLEVPEQNLVARFSQYVTWAGRYPTPRTEQEMDTTVLYSSDWDDFAALYRRLSQHVNTQRAGARD